MRTYGSVGFGVRVLPGSYELLTTILLYPAPPLFYPCEMTSFPSTALDGGPAMSVHR